MTVQAFGGNVFGVLARWTTEIFSPTRDTVPYAVIRHNPLADGERRDYDTLQAALDDFGIDAPLVPTWIPDRMGLPDVTAQNTKDGILFHAVYSNGDTYLRITFNEASRVEYGVLEKDYQNLEDMLVSGIHHYIVTDMDRTKVFWWNGEIEGHISGNITKEEMEKIIGSIYER